MEILIVDDSEELLDLVERALTLDGFEVRLAASVAQGRAALARAMPTVLVLDVALPDGTGVEWCRELRRVGHALPILLLTAHGEVAQRVAGLDAGADDFLVKPFAVAELRARVRALGRRGPLERSTVVALGRTSVEPGLRRASRDGAEVPLTAREWEILELLLTRRGRIVAKSTLLDLLWGEATDKANASLEVLLGRLRRKLGNELIRTVRGEGYVLDAE